MKNILRHTVRIVLKCKENEKISDAVDRHKTNFTKKFSNQSINKNDFEKSLDNISVFTGDTIMVHASWRKFHGFKGTPNEIIKVLIDKVGSEGTILMPCFGSDRTKFDVRNSKSYAGVLSEVFRQYPGVQRSECSHFSICAYGKDAKEYIEDHSKSEFGFDTYSPYFKFSQGENNKVIMMGMGQKPIKLTLIHCVEYVLKDIYPYYKKYLSKCYTAQVTNYKGDVIERKMIEGGYAKLFKKNIKKVYSKLNNDNYKYERLGNIDMVMVNAKQTYNVILSMAHDGKPMLNPPVVKEDSFKRLKS